MSSETIDKQLEALRGGDEVVARRLSELDRNLQAWFKAMRAAQDTILAALRQGGNDVTGPAPRDVRTVDANAPEPPVRETTPESSDSAPRMATSPGGMFQISATNAVVAPEPAGAEMVGDAGSFESTPASIEEDEALLAELDEDTAAKIRVRRRLSKTRRSVREVLAEIEAERGSSNTKWK